MSRQKKKRNKRYQGVDAKQTSPQVIRVSAVKRGKVSQWWHDKKRSVTTIASIIAVIAVVIIIIVELVKLFIK